MAAPSFAETAPRPRRRFALAGLAAGVAALHLALLDAAPRPAAAGPVHRGVVVRRIVVPVPSGGQAAAAAGPTVAAAAPVSRRRVPDAARDRGAADGGGRAGGRHDAGDAGPRTAAEPPMPRGAAAGPAGRAAPAAPAAPAAAPIVPSAAAAAAARPPPGDAPDALAVDARPPPLYPVRLPASRTQTWQRQRATATDAFVVDWRVEDGAYRIVLTGTGGDGWASRGAVGVHGLAPERLVERRRGRDVRATNFRRDVGRISFSGSAAEYPLRPGAQDRLGWLLQLAGIVAAAPQRLAAPGAVVELFVAGSRGDAAAWRFAVEAVEPLDLPGGALPAALRLAREPGQRWEPRIEVWLDPARGFLPVRWRTHVADSGETVDHRLVADDAEAS